MTEPERLRLAAILGMLGSDSAGERDNAARLAEQFRQQHRLTWGEMISGKTIYLQPRDVENHIEVPVYIDRIVYRWPLFWRLRHVNADRGIAIALGLIPAIIILAACGSLLRQALGY